MRLAVLTTAVAVVLSAFAVGAGQKGTPARGDSRNPPAPAAATNSGRVSLTNHRAASDHLRRLFEAKGRAGLAELTEHEDPMISLHAQWELAKADPEKTEEFIRCFETDLGIAPPKWWQETLKGIYIFPGKHHYFPDVGSRKFENSELVRDIYKVVAGPDGNQHAWTEESLARRAGVSHTLRMKHRQSDEVVWDARVWAVHRMTLLGLHVHSQKVLVDDDRVFVFGAESHGAYAEVFQLKDGKPLFRFCTCYWFNFSERWNW